jgi:hypothetical protein
VPRNPVEKKAESLALAELREEKKEFLRKMLDTLEKIIDDPESSAKEKTDATREAAKIMGATKVDKRDVAPTAREKSGPPPIRLTDEEWSRIRLAAGIDGKNESPDTNGA